jgi:putative endonuclease
MIENQYYVYILTRERNSVFYVGMTSDLIKRVNEHKQGVADGFAKKYNVKKLVYYEIHDNRDVALHREKLIKKWKRKYKIDAIRHGRIFTRN